MLKLLDELGDMNDDMKEGARGSLKVVLMLSKWKRHTVSHPNKTNSLRALQLRDTLFF